MCSLLHCIVYTTHAIQNIPEICLFYEIITAFAKAVKGTIYQLILVVHYSYFDSIKTKFAIAKPFQELVELREL